MSGKLHELLAVESSLKGHADRVSKETMVNFTKKEHLFRGKTRRYTPVNDEGERFPDEDIFMTTTVPDRLDYTWKAIIDAMDAVFQKEVTNTQAKADIVLDDENKTIIAVDVPATALLTLECKIKEIRAIIEKAPTLEPGKGWETDAAKDNTWKAKEVITVKTRKVLEFKSVAAATKEHPEQIREVTTDKTIGHWHQVDISGEITSSKKMEMLTRIDTLFRAVKAARARANQTEVVSDKIAEKLFEYISG